MKTLHPSVDVSHQDNMPDGDPGNAIVNVDNDIGLRSYLMKGRRKCKGSITGTVKDGNVNSSDSKLEIS